MEEARRMLERLERIDRLEQRLLAEVERLVEDGERWVAAEGPGAEAAAAALERCRLILRR
jgi:cob(I)alamin adenosyltransferase